MNNNDNYRECHFKIGDVVVPIAGEFRKTFQFGDTAKEMLTAIGKSGCRIVEVENYRCACQKKNGKHHTCILRHLGCNQKIWLMIDDKKTSFAARFFHQLPTHTSKN